MASKTQVKVKTGPQESTVTSEKKWIFNIPAKFLESFLLRIPSIWESQPYCAQFPEHPLENAKEETSAGKSKADISTDFRDPRKIPGAKPATFVYPYADENISAEHRKRFPVIMDIFQQNLQEDKKLSLRHPTKTEYRLKMCGTSINDAQPSILVSHPCNDVKTGLSIMKTLSKPQVREQYDSSLMTVRFKIYLFLGPSFTYFGRPMKSLDIRLRDDSLTGAVLVSDDGGDLISTVTCGVGHWGWGASLFALTPAHAFEQGDEAEEIYAEIVKTINAPERDDEGLVVEDVCEFAGVEYDTAELLQCQDSDVSPPTDRARYQDLTKFDAKILKPKGVWGPKLPTWRLLRTFRHLRERYNHSNLDWALVEIEDSDQWSRPDLAYELIVMDRLSKEKEPVDIMTSRGLLHGTIGSTPAFIANSRQSGSLCEVWTVTPVDSKFDIGDSGALVIRPESQVAYGYVIAANHFKELYVVPLHAALKQIRDTLAIDRPLYAFTQFPLEESRHLGESIYRTDVSGNDLLRGRLLRYWPVRARGAPESSEHSSSVWKPTRQEAVGRSTPSAGFMSGKKTKILDPLVAGEESVFASWGLGKPTVVQSSNHTPLGNPSSFFSILGRMKAQILGSASSEAYLQGNDNSNGSADGTKRKGTDDS